MWSMFVFHSAKHLHAINGRSHGTFVSAYLPSKGRYWPLADLGFCEERPNRERLLLLSVVAELLSMIICCRVESPHQHNLTISTSGCPGISIVCWNWKQGGNTRALLQILCEVAIVLLRVCSCVSLCVCLSAQKLKNYSSESAMLLGENMCYVQPQKWSDFDDIWRWSST